MVNAGKYFGYTFVGRDDEDNMELNIQGRQVKCALLNVLEFSSLRKRMTVILRTSDDRIIVLCKGADSVILPRLHKGQGPLIEFTSNFLEATANIGLRTLLLVQKEIS